MQNQVAAIKRMTDQQLLNSTDKIVTEERRITLEVLLHLREIEVRRLFIDVDTEIDSMYKYCIKRLKYSEGEAQRRLAAARLLRELPEIEPQIQNGNLNLTNLSAVQSFIRAEKCADKPLTREEKLELISTVENKSTRQVKTELIQQSHQPALLADKFQLSESAILDKQFTKFEASMTDNQMEILQEFKNLYAHDLPNFSNHSVLIFLLGKAVQHKKQKLGLIEKSEKKTNKEPNAPVPSADDAASGLSSVLNRSQSTFRTAIPTITKKHIWKRANACCEHIDPTSHKRCGSRFALQIDHVLEVALGGSNKIENLRLLCRTHNSRRAVKAFGTWTELQ